MNQQTNWKNWKIEFYFIFTFYLFLNVEILFFTFIFYVFPHDFYDYSFTIKYFTIIKWVLRTSSSFIYFFACFSFFLGNNTAWMLGKTPPAAMVTPERSLFDSSLLRTASWRCLGTILAFGQRNQPTPRFRQTSIPRQKLSILVLRNQFYRRNVLSEKTVKSLFNINQYLYITA